MHVSQFQDQCMIVIVAGVVPGGMNDICSTHSGGFASQSLD